MLLLLTTAPEKEAEKIRKKIVEERLAACALAFPVSSLYWWKGKIEKSGEVLLIFKTTEKKKEEIMKRVRELHPYELPFIAFFKVEASEDYEKWVEEVVE